MSRVTINDATALGYCRKGGRSFAARYGIDWLKFLTEGIDSSVLEDIDDEMVKAVIEQSRRREAAENG